MKRSTEMAMEESLKIKRGNLESQLAPKPNTFCPLAAAAAHFSATPHSMAAAAVAVAVKAESE